MSGRDYDTLLAETIDVISRLHHQEINKDTRLVADLSLDSVDIAELVAEMEDHFDVIIPMEKLSEIRTVQDIAQNLAPLVLTSQESAEPV